MSHQLAKSMTCVLQAIRPFEISIYNNPCQEAPCRNGGNCTLQENRQHYNCECKKGFEGEHCDQAPDIRLVGSSNKYEGRLEVYHNGHWGTVCDDYWDQNSNGGTVACRQLGFSGLQSYDTDKFGQGTGFIWLDDIRCTGTEQRIQDCPHIIIPGGVGHCSHSEDVGIICIP
ncbi:Soluble scavenger receptor cysteine-rich domain-containing protein SSC5D [Exaiptasia diaphana]|nr:Soluble scavenger receptor cysteine-rich domain-containing protein SSC5D [Exaiptasia diaphana]